MRVRNEMIARPLRHQSEFAFAPLLRQGSPDKKLMLKGTDTLLQVPFLSHSSTTFLARWMPKLTSSVSLMPSRPSGYWPLAFWCVGVPTVAFWIRTKSLEIAWSLEKVWRLQVMVYHIREFYIEYESAGEVYVTPSSLCIYIFQSTNGTFCQDQDSVFKSGSLSDHVWQFDKCSNHQLIAK